jgi:glycosyltransferase involved in cell wall biosynthesis
LHQTRSPDEILVVDDGSPDDLAAALAPYGGLVTLVRKENGGAASARNLGIDRSRGDLIAFLDADDYWEPAKLERQLSVFRRHPEVGLVASRFYVEQPGQPRYGPFPEKAEPFLDRVLSCSGTRAFEVATLLWTTVIVVRRGALGDHRFVSGLEPAEDRDLWVRIVASNPVYIDGGLAATWVLEPGSLSRSSIDTDCGNMLRVVRRHADLLGPWGLRHWEADTFRRWAAVHLSQGRPRAAMERAWDRLRLQPFSAQAWWICLKSAALAAVSAKRGQQAT